MQYMFKGFTSKDVAQLLGVDMMTVYAAIKDFQKEADRVGVMEAAKSEGIEPTVQGLIRLSRDLSSRSLDPEVCLRGANLARRLEELGVSMDKLEEFVEVLYGGTSEAGLPISELVKIMADFKQYSKEEEKGLGELIISLQTLREDIEKSRKEEQSLMAQITKSRQALEKKLEKKNVTETQLDDYTKTKKALQKHGVNLEDLALLETLITNMKEQEYQPKKILELFTKHQDLTSETKALESRSVELEKQVAVQMKTVMKLQENMRNNEEMLNSIRQLKECSVTPDQVIYIASTIKAVGAENGLAPEQALTKLGEDIKTGYNMKLGFESSLENLQVRWEALSERLKMKEEELQALSSVAEARKDVLDALHRLDAAGVSDTELRNWGRIIEENGYDVTGFRREMERFGDVKIIVGEKTTKLLELEAREKSLLVAKELLENEIETERESLKRLLNEIIGAVEILVKQTKKRTEGATV